MPLTADTNTDRRSGKVVSVPLEANARVFGGSLVARNADGYGVPAAAAPGLKVVGIAERAASNVGGIRGAVRVDVEKTTARLSNSATNPLTVANCESAAFVQDDGTVAAIGGANPVIAGLVVEVDPEDSSFVWVDTYRASTLPD